MCLEFLKNLEPELNEENIKLVRIGIEDCVESPLSSKDNPDPLKMRLFPGGLVFCQQPLSVSGFNKYRFFKFLFNQLNFFSFYFSSSVAEAP